MLIIIIDKRATKTGELNWKTKIMLSECLLVRRKTWMLKMEGFRGIKTNDFMMSSKSTLVHLIPFKVLLFVFEVSKFGWKFFSRDDLVRKKFAFSEAFQYDIHFHSLHDFLRPFSSSCRHPFRTLRVWDLKRNKDEKKKVKAEHFVSFRR